MHRYEKQKTLGYILNSLRGARYSPSNAVRIGMVIGDYQEFLGVRVKHLLKFSSKDCNQKYVMGRRTFRAMQAEEFELDWGKFRKLLENSVKSISQTKPSPIQKKLDLLSDMVRLSPIESELVGLAFRIKTDDRFEELLSELSEAKHGGYVPFSTARPSAVASLLGVRESRIDKLLSADSILLGSGLLSVCTSGNVTASESLCNAVIKASPTQASLRKQIMGRVSKAQLKWSDFEHLDQERDYMLRLIDGALESRAKGVNILVYGPPGTGKTELCRSLAKKAGANLYVIGENDHESDGITSRDRFQALLLAQRILEHDPKALLLFDEGQDILQQIGYDPLGFSPFPSRSFNFTRVSVHRMLENARVPVLWTANAIGSFGGAVLRRFSYAAEIPTPPKSVQAQMWKRKLVEESVNLEEGHINQLAAEFNASPSVISSAVRATKLVGGGIEEIRRNVSGIVQAIGDRPLPPQASAHEESSYSLDLINSKTDVSNFAERLLSSGKLNFSMLLYGEPGSGKSAFARFLADKLGLAVIQKRASDLKSMWVGGTEKEIAASFREARDSRAILIFDEVDSMLFDRKNAVRSFEISSVNEMLTWMESHPFPFICTTNFVESVDSAALRRFTFKEEFKPYDGHRIDLAFRYFFNCSAPSSVLKLANITPGDFACIRKKAELLDYLKEPDELGRLLSEESQAKPGGKSSIGFST